MNITDTADMIRNILIIDDDEDDSYLLMEAIEEIDHHIQCVALVNGSVAMDYIKHTSTSLPDLIFLDLNMPELTGKGFLKLRNNDPLLKNIPVTVYSTSSAPLDIEETRMLGAFYYIRKPFSFSEFKNEVNHVLELAGELVHS